MDIEIEKKIGELNAEHSKLLVDLQARYEEQLKGKIAESDFKAFEEKVDKRWTAIEEEVLKLKAPARGPETKDAAAERKAFFGQLRKGAAPPEQKGLIASDDTLGGYLVAPGEYVREIIKAITEKSPIRSLATVRSTSQRSISIPKRTGQFSAARTAEIATRTETTGLAYGLEEMSLPEAYATVKVSRQMLEDSAFNLEAEITSEIVEQFEVLEGAEFTSGNGSGRAEGFLSNASIVAAAIETAGSNAIAADDLVGLQYALKSPYVRNATWVMKRATVKTVRTLKEATTNAYIWQPGLQVGQPASLLGSPVVECTDMPSGLVDNQLEVAYGDFKIGYLVADRISLEIQRLNELYAATGEVGFLARKRFNGQVVLPEAIKVLKIKA